MVGTGSSATTTTKTLYYLYDASGSVAGLIYNGNVYYFQKNIQGDIIRICNVGGDTVVEYTYDAWGKALSVTGTMAFTLGQDNPFRYRGYYYDAETGFYYLQTRYYDPEVGRFLNADCIIGANGNIPGYNMFAYCSNNPVVGYDPCGNAAVICFGLEMISMIKSFFLMGGGGFAFPLIANVANIVLQSMNETHNSKVDNDDDTSTKGKLVENQKETEEHFEFGITSAADTACEAIALHNARILKGDLSSLSENITLLQSTHSMMLFGYWGTNPVEIGNALSILGMDYTSVDIKEMTKKGVYILSYLNENFF